MSPVSRLLRIVTVVRPPEIPKALLLTLNSFLLIFGYYQIKAAREGLLLAAHAASRRTSRSRRCCCWSSR